MTELLNKILRPVFGAVFRYVYPYVPWHRKILWFFSKHYFVNGTAECMRMVNELVLKKGYRVLLNYCTEDAECPLDAKRAERVYRELVDVADYCNRAMPLSAALSVKMSQFGCFLEREDAGVVLEDLIKYASSKHVWVTLDGERLKYAADVVKFGELMHEKYGNIQIRLQAYNPDFPFLLQRIMRGNASSGRPIPMKIGICKGAYHEKRACNAKETRKNFVAEAFECLVGSQSISLDTHDEKLLNEIDNLIAREGPVPAHPSFGLLYNVKPHLARKLHQLGNAVSIYLPVIRSEEDGDAQWEKFAIRRLLERPVYIFLPFKLLAGKLIGRRSY